MMNLLLNAVSHSTKIMITYSYLKDSSILKVCIIDDGPGVKKKYVDAIFKPFNTVRVKPIH